MVSELQIPLSIIRVIGLMSAPLLMETRAPLVHSFLVVLFITFSITGQFYRMWSFSDHVDRLEEGIGCETFH